MTREQTQIAKKYANAYPHLKLLAQNAELDARAARSLGQQIGRLACPPTVSATELWIACSIGH